MAPIVGCEISFNVDPAAPILPGKYPRAIDCEFSALAPVRAGNTSNAEVRLEEYPTAKDVEILAPVAQSATSETGVR